jgi:RimJ/RimL family protein N-acetyltransferase
MSGQFALTTERLVLRGWRDDDLEPYFAMCSDPGVMEFLGGLATEASCWAGIARQRTGQAERGHCFWAVERQADHAFLGFCGLKPGQEKTPIEGGVEIGWRLRGDVWGEGYAREAAQASLDWAWANLAEDAIWAITVPANLRSWGLMERLGMTRHAGLDFDMSMPLSGEPMRHITYSVGRAS